MRKIFITSRIVLFICCLTTLYGCSSNLSFIDSKQVGFIRTFVSSFGQTDASDSMNLIRDKLYDKKIIGNLYDFGWYHAASVYYKDTHSVQRDKTKEIVECMNYLSMAYPSINIEVYEVHLESVLDSDKPKTLKKDEYDVFYLAQKGDKYYLLYTQTLFKNSKQSAENIIASLNGYINPNDID